MLTTGESEDSYVDESQHHHHQAPTSGASLAPGLDAQDSRPAHVFNSPYGGYAGGAPLPPMSSSVAIAHSGGSVGGGASTKKVVPQPDGLFPDVPEAKKRKFVLVEDRGSRLRVRVTLNMVDTSEIPDSFRRSNAVCPGSFFPREMESPPPSPTGRRFFLNDLDDVEDLNLGNDVDGGDEVEASSDAGAGRRRHHHRRQRMAMSGGSDSLDGTTTMAAVPVGDSVESEVAVPRMRKALRRKQVRLNDLGCRMAWLQSRAFAGRRIFLQKACTLYPTSPSSMQDNYTDNLIVDTYRSKTCNGIQASMHDVSDIAPHYEMRVGKKKWLSCEREIELRQLSQT